MRENFSLCVICLYFLDISLVYVGSLGDHSRFIYGVYLAIFLDVIEKLFLVANLIGVLAVIDESKSF